MKPAHAVSLFWLLNAAVLCAATLCSLAANSGLNRDLDEPFDRDPNAVGRRVDWQQSFRRDGSSGAFEAGSTVLSPTPRPKKITPVDTGPVTVTQPKTDDELRDELARWLKEKFKLVRVVYSGTPADCRAIVRAAEAGTDVFLWHGFNFRERFADAQGALRKIARDQKVVRIDQDAVLFHMAALGHPDKHFDVTLNFSGEPSTLYTGDRPGITIPRQQKDPPKEALPTRSSYDAQTDTWTVGADHLIPATSDDIASALSVVVDARGQAIGLQVRSDTPKENVLLRHGAQPGDIIKAINGNSVRSLAAARAYVVEARKHGVTRFDVTYERDGLEGHKNFVIPAKK